MGRVAQQWSLSGRLASPRRPVQNGMITPKEMNAGAVSYREDEVKISAIKIWMGRPVAEKCPEMYKRVQLLLTQSHEKRQKTVKGLTCTIISQWVFEGDKFGCMLPSALNVPGVNPPNAILHLG